MFNEAMKLKDAYSLEEKLSKPRQHIKKQTSLCQQRSTYSKLCFFSSGHVQMWKLDRKKTEHGRTDLQIVVLENTPESLLDSKIKPVNPKGN